jgi:DNA (cytosine-5)-methyltransferase 1
MYYIFWHCPIKEYIVRRLTPTECARLQGFPDSWCSDLGTENPTMDELRFWYNVFADYGKVMGKKPKSLKAIKRWLKNPHSDSAEYKMWGNGVCLNIVIMLMLWIKKAAEKDYS